MSSLTTGTTTGTAAVLTADTTGDCVIKTGSSATTAMTISGSTQAVTLAGSLVLGSSTLAAPSGSAPSFTCRAWVNFNGTGTVAIRASGNVSSLVDNGVGDYTVNFTTAMPDADYSVSGAQGDTGSTNAAGMFATNRVGSNGDPATPTASAVRVNTTNSLGNVRDNTYVYVSVFR